MTVYHSMQHRERTGANALLDAPTRPDLTDRTTPAGLDRVREIQAINQVVGILTDHGLQSSPLYREACRALALARTLRPLTAGQVAALRLSAIASYRHQEEREWQEWRERHDIPRSEPSRPFDHQDHHEHHEQQQDHDRNVLHRAR
ncbi:MULTISPECIES: hypothetical protein [Micromonospora]|uniref:Uncharacterized protein n=1 Tax=Micromonospora yangpuensis TaxID=683228 RepID=A0A1C6UC50_9ACTN|nr:hypothetical protein [Micromonospora yangpuensis]GGL86380.1 hypothetical protein GCM10012279_00070 [Micromonospora yangpuensis]SCL51534.1 hypothetical protein GA0070617_1807 [Micromonospora yangpuensis]